MPQHSRQANPRRRRRLKQRDVAMTELSDQMTEVSDAALAKLRQMKAGGWKILASKEKP